MVQIELWAAQVSAWKQSGQTVKQWCAENRMAKKTFYYHRKRVREEMLEAAEKQKKPQMPELMGTGFGAVRTEQGHVATFEEQATVKPAKLTFAALPMPQPETNGAAMTVRMGEFSVDIQNSADDVLVGQVLRMVARL
jgi:phosphorylcholine metabolism protein LicD